MLVQSGLYYPYIHVRNDRWLKAAALYWKRVDRIVPSEYPTRDSRTVKVLTHELGFIENRRPGGVAETASQLFLDFLREHGSDTASALRMQPSTADLARAHARGRDAGIGDDGRIGYIFAEKMSPDLVDVMSALGLAFGASDEHVNGRRMSMNIGSAGWIGMDSRLAAVYMTVLTRLTARQFDLNPVTDVPSAHTAMTGWDVEAVANSIIGQEVAPSINRNQQLEQRVALLAVESVIPRNLGLIDADEIVRFRKRNEHLLGAFQSAVAAAAAELAHLPADVDSRVLRERVIEMTQHHLIKPQANLEKAMNMSGLESIRSVLTFQTPLLGTAATAAVAGTAGAAIWGQAAGGGVALVALGAGEVSRRRDLRMQEPVASYLMELRSLTPSGVLRRQLRGIRSRQA